MDESNKIIDELLKKHFAQIKERDKKIESLPYDFNNFYRIQFNIIPFLYFVEPDLIPKFFTKYGPDANYEILKACYKMAKVDLDIDKDTVSSFVVKGTDSRFYFVLSFDHENYNIQPLARYIVIPLSDSLFQAAIFTLEPVSNGNYIVGCLFPNTPALTNSSDITRELLFTINDFTSGLANIDKILSDFEKYVEEREKKASFIYQA